MIKLKLNENVYTSNQFEILQEEKKFNESLYKSPKVRVCHPFNPPFFDKENITTLNDQDRSSCKGQVAENECLSALKEFKNGKSPGTAGLSAEFYKFFWADLGTDMTASFKGALSRVF